MIDADEVFRIIAHEMTARGWAAITQDDETYGAVQKPLDGRQIWSVRGKGLPVKGCSYSFLIDAETGEMIECRRYGTR